MSYPSEYEKAVNELKTLRKNIERTFVEGRVKALLDASVKGLHQYAVLLRIMMPRARLIGNINRYNIIFGGLGVPSDFDNISQVKAKYTGGKASYPIYLPHNVSARELPQVDVFLYKPPSDVELLDKGSSEIWANSFLLQTNRHVYSTVADATNVYYDYYKMSPIGRVQVEASLSNPVSGFESYTKLRGEATVLYCSVQEAETGTFYDYDLYAFLDADFFTSSGFAKTVPLAVIVTDSDYNLPENTFVCAGKRISTKSKGLYVGWVQDGQLVGFTKTHGTVTFDSVSAMYAEPRTLTIESNPIEGGYTNPSGGTYNKKSTDVVTVTAYPYGGWAFLGWLVDGAGVPSTVNPIQLKMYRDHTLTALFKPVASTIIRPNANDEAKKTSPYPESLPLYDCVDDTVADGDKTHIYLSPWITPAYAYFHLTDPTIPSGSTIVKVVVWALVREPSSTWWEPPTKVSLSVKTYGVKYVSDRISVKGEKYRPIKYAWSKNPYTGQLWTLSEVNDLRAGLYLDTTSSIMCTQLYVEVVYTTE